MYMRGSWDDRHANYKGTPKGACQNKDGRSMWRKRKRPQLIEKADDEENDWENEGRMQRVQYRSKKFVGKLPSEI